MGTHDIEQKNDTSLDENYTSLSATKEFLMSLVSSCPDAIVAIDREGTFILFNEAAERLTGFNREEMVGRFQITAFYRTPEMARQLKKMIYSPHFGGPGRVEGVEVEVQTQDGRSVPIRLSATLVLKDGKEIGSVGFFHDLTQRKQLEDELRRLSITDSLTGLYNRRQFYMMLTEEVNRAVRYNRPLCLVCLDLDNFKPINDTYGHQEGDNILRLLGQCARHRLRAQDFAFRYGGDEFAILMVENDLGQASRAADRFRRSFNESCGLTLSLPQDKTPPVSLSMGVAQLESGESPENLFKRADLAMYEAKRAGGDRIIEAGPHIGRTSIP